MSPVNDDESRAEAVLREARTSHDERHALERDAVGLALDHAKENSEEHRVTHDRSHTDHQQIHTTAHDVHIRVHEAEQEAVRTALDAVARERKIHADAHEREHLSHSQVHDLAQRAVDKAEKAVEDRLSVMNAFRDQLRDQAANFVTRDLAEEKNAEKEKAISLMRKDIDRRFDEMLGRITDLEKYDVATKGRTTGASSSVTWIVTAIGLIATLMTIGIIISNILPRAA